MRRAVAWLRRNPTTVPFVILGAFIALTAFRGESTRDQVTEIVHQATCGGGHARANLAACHRLCPNLSTISNLRCTSVAKEVAARNGNSSPSGQHSPAGDGGAGGTHTGGGIVSHHSNPPSQTPSVPAQSDPVGDTVKSITDTAGSEVNGVGCTVNGLLEQPC